MSYEIVKHIGTCLDEKEFEYDMVTEYRIMVHKNNIDFAELTLLGPKISIWSVNVGSLSFFHENTLIELADPLAFEKIIHTITCLWRKN